MIRITASILSLVSLTAVLRAEPLDRRQVPADAKWLIHLDADAAHHSKLGKAAIETARTTPALQQGLANAQTMFGIDLTADLAGITAYSNDFTPDSAVVIVRGKLNHERMLTLLHSAPNQKTSRLREHEVYSWTEVDMRDPAKPAHASSAAFADDTTFVVSQSEAKVRAALDVLDGKATAIQVTDSPLAHAPPQDTILEAAVTGLTGVPDLPAQSPIVRQCDSGILWVGEHAGKAFVHAEVLARSEEVAAQIRNLVAGVAAMAQLQAGNRPEVSKVLMPLQVTCEARAVRLDWQMPADDLLGIVSTEIQRQFAAPADVNATRKDP